ncbi:MAG: hypothetical protein IKM45_03565 [Opitutales bacterium]|nr:hypothetical protein [Opitutales bacterium]
MNRRLRLAFALCASVILSVACSTKPSQPEKPVPVVQITTVQAEPLSLPKPEISKAELQKSDAPKKTPQTNMPVEKSEKKEPTGTQQLKPNPEPKKTEAPKPSPEPVVVKEPLPPPAKTITLRCAYWDKPSQNIFDIYVRQNGKFQRCQLFELVFSQKLTPEVEKDGKVTVYRKIDGDFLPIFSIDPCGMDNLAVVILPKFNPNEPDGAYVQLLDLEEKKFPKGALKVINWSKEDVVGDIVFRASDINRRFLLRCGEFFISDSLTKNRDICNISFVDPQDQNRPVYESAFSLFKENQTILFVLKNRETGEFEFKMSKIR